MASTSKLFGILELLSSIIDHCTVKSRSNIAQTNKFHYNVVQDGYRRRIERELLTWFTRPELAAFWSCLDESDGVIGGCVAINTIIPLNNIPNLDIFVPKGKEKKWETLLFSLGWGLFFSNAHFARRREKFTTQWWKHPNTVSFLVTNLPTISNKLTSLHPCE